MGERNITAQKHNYSLLLQMFVVDLLREALKGIKNRLYVKRKLVSYLVEFTSFLYCKFLYLSVALRPKNEENISAWH